MCWAVEHLRAEKMSPKHTEKSFPLSAFVPVSRTQKMRCHALVFANSRRRYNRTAGARWMKGRLHYSTQFSFHLAEDRTKRSPTRTYSATKNAHNVLSNYTLWRFDSRGNVFVIPAGHIHNHTKMAKPCAIKRWSHRPTQWLDGKCWK